MNPIHKRILYHEGHKRGLNGKPDALIKCRPTFMLHLAIWGIEL